MEPAEQDAADERGWWHPRRWGWTGWAVAALTVVAIAVGVLALWVRSESDLRAIDARAKSLGVPTTWAAHGLVLSSEERLAGWRRLMQIAEGLEAYYDSEAMKPGLELSEGLRRHHAGRSQAVRNEIDALCRSLGGSPLVTRTAVTAANGIGDATGLMLLGKLIAADIAFAAPDVVPATAAQALDVITCRIPDTWLGFMIASANVAAWQKAVIYRANDAGVDRATLAILSKRTSDWLRVQWTPAMIGEFLVQRNTSLDELATGQLAHNLFRLQQGPLASMVNRLLGRAGRSVAMDLVMDLAVLDSPRGGSSSPRLESGIVLQQARSAIDRLKTVPAWDPRYLVARQLTPDFAGSLTSWCCRIAALDTCAAEWSGQPWPADPTDPARKPVRPVVRDGRTIGFYLLKDGVDDGGLIRSDFCFALSEPLGKPKAADPYNPPSR